MTAMRFRLCSGLLILALAQVCATDTFAQSAVACTPLTKPIRYVVQKGDYPAAILRKFELEPVFTKKGSMPELLKINKFANPNVIEPKSEILLPFKCEEQAQKWTLVNREKDRLVTAVKISDQSAVPSGLAATAPLSFESKPGTTVPVIDELLPSKPVEPDTKVATTDVKLDEVLKPVDVKGQPVDVELANLKPEEISEALRYRMICEGEWTGTECISRYSTVYLTFGGWYNRYDGKDPSATTNNEGLLLSKLNPELGIGWTNYWNENIKTRTGLTLQNSEILPEARDIPITQDKKLLTGLMGEARYEKGAWGVGGGVRQFDKLFYRFNLSGLTTPGFCVSGFSGCGVSVHSASIFSYFLNASYILHQAGKFRVDTMATWIHLGTGATGGFTIQEGSGWDLDLTVSHDRVKEYMYGTIRYGESSQDTSIEKQSAKELGFIFGYAWKLKDW